MVATNTRRYAALGAAFGTVFPGVGTALYAWTHGVGPLTAQAEPLLWIIDTAPVFLGVFAGLAGRRQDAVEALVHQLEHQIAATEGARRRAAEAEEAATAASTAKSTFLADMSHELRTPLNAILGYTELLLDTTDEEEREVVDDLGRVHESANHLLTLINDILDLSRVEAGKLELALSPCPIDPLVHTAVETVAHRCVGSRNTLELDLSPALSPALVDPMRMRQVLVNLLANACKFTQDGTVRVRTRAGLDPAGSPWVCVEVADTGIGMTPGQLERVFDPFVQATRETSQRYGGTGLGLALCRRFCDGMGGRLLVDSQPGQGSTFTVWVPAAPG